MKVSYNEATGAGCSTLEQDLKICEECGFDYIEIRGDMLLEYLMDHSIEELRSFFQKSRIKPHAINALYLYDDMFHPQKADRARDRALMAFFVACCQISKQIGNHYFIVVPHLLDDTGNIYLPHDPNTQKYPVSKDKAMEDAVRVLTKLSNIAEDYEMNLAFEPVGSNGCAVRTVQDTMEIVNALNRDNVGITLDPFNLYLNGKLNDFSAIRQIPKEKIFAVHINNCDPLPLGKLDHCDRRFVDSGEIDLDNYLSNVKATGYDGMVSIETFRPEYYAMPAKQAIAQAYYTTWNLIKNY